MAGVLYGNQRYFFILGHMRGYTTLLSHILGTHPQVLGYREHHLSYNSLAALKTLRRSVAAEPMPDKQPGAYILDKLLHNNLALADFILASPNVFVVFMLREAEATLGSILGLFPDWSERQAVAYYVARLAWMQQLAACRALSPARALYVDGQGLVDDPAATLGAMQRFLQLAEPLSEHYALFRHSGERGYGDSSPALRAGRILQERPAPSAAISAAALDRSAEAHRQCRDNLLQRCPATSVG